MMKKTKIKKTSELKSFVKWLKLKKIYATVGINLHRPPESALGWIIASQAFIQKMFDMYRKRKYNFQSGGQIVFKGSDKVTAGIPIEGNIFIEENDFVVNKSKIESHKDLISGCSSEVIKIESSPCCESISGQIKKILFDKDGLTFIKDEN